MNFKLKYVLCLSLIVMVMSCSSDDDNSGSTPPPPPEEVTFAFTLNNQQYTFDNPVIELDPTNSTMRRVTVNFNDSEDSSRQIRFWMPVDETGNMGQFVYTENNINHMSNVNDPGRATNISLHSDSEMNGTFSIILFDTIGEPLFTFTNGEFNLDF